MTSTELRKKIEEKMELSQRAYEAYQQLQGQIALLRDMYKDAQIQEQKDKEIKKEPTEETK